MKYKQEVKQCVKKKIQPRLEMHVPSDPVNGTLAALKVTFQDKEQEFRRWSAWLDWSNTGLFPWKSSVIARTNPSVSRSQNIS